MPTSSEHSTEHDPHSPAAPESVSDKQLTSTTTTGASANSFVTPTLRVASEWGWRMLVVVAIAAVGIFLIMTFKVIVVSVMVAVLLAVLLQPFASFLRKKARFPKSASAAASLVVLVLFVAGLVALASSTIVGGVSQLWTKALAGIDEAILWLETGPLAMSNTDLSGLWERVTTQLADNQETIFRGALSATSTATHFFSGLLIALFCTFFFLYDGRSIWTWVVRVFPLSHRAKVDAASLRGWATLSGYVRTQVVVAAVDAIGIGLGAWILGLPLAVPIGILVFVGSFVPIVGALVTGTVAVAVALVDQGLVRAVIMLGIVLLVQQIEGHVLQPWLMSRAVSIHPVAVLLSVTAGTMVAGIVGALFAVPVVAVTNTVVTYFKGRDKYPELGPPDEGDSSRGDELMAALNQGEAKRPAPES